MLRLLRIWRARLVVVDSWPTPPDLVFTGLELRCFCGDCVDGCWLWFELADELPDDECDVETIEELIDVGVNMAFELEATTGMVLLVV